MPYGDLLYFDPETDRQVRAVWQALADAGVAPLPPAGIRPHISLVAYEELPAEAEARLRELAAAPPLPVLLDHLGLFLHPEPVLFVEPLVTPALLELQRRAYAGLGGQHTNPYYMPGRWAAHCTLAYPFERARLVQAVEIAERFPLPHTALLTEIAVIHIPPVEEVFSFRFAG